VDDRRLRPDLIVRLAGDCPAARVAEIAIALRASA